MTMFMDVRVKVKRPRGYPYGVEVRTKQIGWYGWYKRCDWDGDNLVAGLGRQGTLDSIMPRNHSRDIILVAMQRLSPARSHRMSLEAPRRMSQHEHNGRAPIRE